MGIFEKVFQQHRLILKTSIEQGSAIDHTTLVIASAMPAAFLIYFIGVAIDAWPVFWVALSLESLEFLSVTGSGFAKLSATGESPAEVGAIARARLALCQQFYITLLLGLCLSLARAPFSSIRKQAIEAFAHSVWNTSASNFLVMGTFGSILFLAGGHWMLDQFVVADIAQGIVTLDLVVALFVLSAASMGLCMYVVSDVRYFAMRNDSQQ